MLSWLVLVSCKKMILGGDLGGSTSICCRRDLPTQSLTLPSKPLQFQDDMLMDGQCVWDLGLDAISRQALKVPDVVVGREEEERSS